MSDQTEISVQIYVFISVTCHSVLCGLIKEKEKGEKFLSFLSTQLASLPFVCLSFLPSLQSVPHSPRPLMFASHSSFYSLVRWLSFNYAYSPMRGFSGEFSSCLPAESRKDYMLLCRSSASQQDVALVDCRAAYFQPCPQPVSYSHDHRERP